MKKADGGNGGDASSCPTTIFGIEPNVAVMHQVVTAQLAAKRAGTHSTKTRAEVSRRRRQAVAPEGHRPRPPGLDPLAAVARRRRGARPEAARLLAADPKKMVRLALRSALSDRAAEGKVIVVDDWGIDRAEDEGRRSQLLESARVCATKGERGTRACSSCSYRTEEAVWKSFRNLGERVQIILPEELNTYDVLVNDWIVFSTGDARQRRSPASPTATDADDADGRRRRREAREGSPRHHHQARRVARSPTPRYDENVYTFVVAPDANKIEIRKAVEELFGKQGRRRCTRSTARASASATAAPARGRHRAAQKRAIVTLAAGEDRIDIFGS